MTLFDIRIRLDTDHDTAVALRDQFARDAGGIVVAKDVAQATQRFRVLTFDKKKDKAVTHTIEAINADVAAEAVRSDTVAVVEVR